jgi:hypothetical protein
MLDGGWMAVALSWWFVLHKLNPNLRPQHNCGWLASCLRIGLRIKALESGALESGSKEWVHHSTTVTW